MASYPNNMDNQNLIRMTGYLFIAQFLLFVAFFVLLLPNSQFFVPSETIVWGDFLTALSNSPTGFFVLKGLLLALRTCYALSFVGIAIIFWQKNRMVAPFLVSFILVSVAIINIAQLMGIALVPISQNYALAVSQGESLRVASLEATAQGIYILQEYLDLFVNVVTFIGVFTCFFLILNQESEIKFIKWLIPVMVIMPYNRFFDLPVFIVLGSSLINVVVTALWFLLLGRFLLKLYASNVDDS